MAKRCGNYNMLTCLHPCTVSELGWATTVGCRGIEASGRKVI
jgi:hypothetical protein